METNDEYHGTISRIFGILDTYDAHKMDTKHLEVIYSEPSRLSEDDRVNFGIEELKKSIPHEHLANKVLKVLDEFKTKADTPYQASVKKIMTILDTNHNGTIDLQEFEALYPGSSGHILFERFDLNQDGELDAEEFKEFIHTIKFATKILRQLQEQEYEKNMIVIVDFLPIDLSESMSLKKLNICYPNAANYLYTHFDDLDENYEIGVKELRQYINSYTLSKEFLKALKTKTVEVKPYGIFDCCKTCSNVACCDNCQMSNLSSLFAGWMLY